MNYSQVTTGRNIRILKFLLLIISVFAVFSTAAFLSAVTVNAATDSAYELVKYEKETIIYDSHSYDVQTKIKVNLPRKRDTLEIALPSGNFQVTDINIENTDVEYLVNTGSDNSVITLKSKDGYFSKGVHIFNIFYRINEYSERIEEYDLLYYDALLPKWKIPMGELLITIHLPEDFPMKNIEGYAGRFGVQDKTGKVQFVVNDTNNTVIISGVRIPENYSVNVSAQLPDGYWVGALDHTWAAYAICIMMAVMIIVAFVLWFIGGRDPKVEKKTEKHPIEGINPVEISYILDGRFRIRDISSLLIYFGTRGYLKISQYEPKKYKLIKLEEPKSEPRYIRNLYNLLFERVYDNRGIEVDKLGPRLNLMYKTAQMDVSAGFNDRDMSAVTSISALFRIVLLVIIALVIGTIPVFRGIYSYVDIPYIEALVVAVASFAAVCFITRIYEIKFELSRARYIVTFSIGMLAYIGIIAYELYRFIRVSRLYYVAVIVLAAALVTLLIAIYMPARGRGNAELAARLLSLRSWIYHCKPNDVDELFFENNDYYYDMMPFACSFSGLESWAKTFKWLRVLPPEWYSDDIVGHAESNNPNAMYSYDIAKDIKAFVRTVEDYYYKTARYYRTDRKRTRQG